MLKGIYDAASGMLPQIVRQDVVANNLANAGTAGFKRELVFSQEFTKAQQKTLNKQVDWEKVQITGVTIDFSQGPIERTGNSLDLAIDGDAFFVISTPSGEMFTRCGNFALSPDGELVTSDGYAVLSETGEISVPGSQFVVDSQGQMTVEGKPVGTLRLVSFAQPYPLRRAAPGLFAPVAGAPAPTQPENFVVIQGALERANVNLINEMVQMIESYRHFETAQRMVQIQDESLDKAINQLGVLRG